MRDPFTWSFPVGRMFGITVRVHLLFPIFALGMILRTVHAINVPGVWIDASILMGLTFLSVLLHEFGHCFMARSVGGDANEVLLWPLGGLANVDVPHSARANFLVTAGGPLVNLVICLVSGLALVFAFEQSWWPPFNPLVWSLCPTSLAPGQIFMTHWDGSLEPISHLAAPVILGQIFWVNWGLFLFNVLILGYPLDGGRMLQAGLWPFVGYRQATMCAVFSGFIFMILILIVSFGWNEVMLLLLAVFIYTACKQQWIILETGGEDSLFGYDFSQGYTSLEKERQEQPHAGSRTSSGAGASTAPPGNSSASSSGKRPTKLAWISCCRRSSAPAPVRSPRKNDAFSRRSRIAIGTGHRTGEPSTVRCRMEVTIRHLTVLGSPVPENTYD